MSYLRSKSLTDYIRLALHIPSVANAMPRGVFQRNLPSASQRWQQGLICALSATLLISGCSSVGVDKQSVAKTLVAQRGNIVTDNKLSTATASALLSAGLNEQACMLHFDVCMEQLSDSQFNDNYRPALAMFAELHYSKARQLANSEDCQRILERPPLDPYYANAPLLAAEQQRQQQSTQRCLADYHGRLIDTIKFSYAYLFYDELIHDFAQSESKRPKLNRRLPSELDIQTQDLYNAASNDLITQLYQSNNQAQSLLGDVRVDYLADKRSNTATEFATADQVSTANQQVKVMRVVLNNPSAMSYELNVYLPNEDNYLVNARKSTNALADLVSTYELKLTGLNTVSKRDGFGISFVASLDDRYTTSVRQLLSASLGKHISTTSSRSTQDSQPSNRIYRTGHLLLTGFIKPSGKSVLEVLSSNTLDIHMFNPYRTDRISLLGDEYPLAANFSASYGLWLAENQLNSVGYLNLLARKDATTLPKLFMLQPYDPNKRVIIMLHGLASSPATWVNLTNDIFNDATLRDNYQVWQIFYPTNLPILENRYQIQQLIETAYQQTDPKGQNPASQHSVIISHSMGAIIARMLVSNNDLSTRLDALNERPNLNLDNEQPGIPIDRTLSAMLKNTYGQENLADRFKLTPLPQVDTVVFLSAPFRGTDYADRWFTRALRRVIHLPLGLVQTVTGNLATIATQGELADNPLGALYLQNGASQLSDKSSFVQLTKDIEIVPEVTYHSIIANADTDIAEGLAQLRSSMLTLDLSETSDPKDSSASTESVQPSSVATTALSNASQQHLETSNKTSADANFTETASAAEPQTAKTYAAAIQVEEDLGEALTDKLSDGIVPYNSSHLDGAASETIIRGGHSIQENPQTILTLRRILHQQLEDSNNH